MPESHVSSAPRRGSVGGPGSLTNARVVGSASADRLFSPPEPQRARRREGAKDARRRIKRFSLLRVPFASSRSLASGPLNPMLHERSDGFRNPSPTVILRYSEGSRAEG